MTVPPRANKSQKVQCFKYLLLYRPIGKKINGSDVHEVCLTYNCEVMAPRSVGQLQDAANMAI